MNWVTVIVLFLVLKRFFFEKVYNFVLARENAVKETLDNAEATSRIADEKLEDYNRRIADIEGEGREIIKNAKIKADIQANDIIAEANGKAEAMLEDAVKEIEREKTKAISEMKSQISIMALMTAEKIMEKNLEMEGQDAFIDRIIDQVGTSKWQNYRLI